MSRKIKLILTFIMLVVISAAVGVLAYASAEPDAVTVRFLDEDGTLITTVSASTGDTVTFPEGKSAVAVDGWVGYVPLEWNESLTVPDGVSEYNITARRGGAV